MSSSKNRAEARGIASEAMSGGCMKTILDFSRKPSGILFKNRTDAPKSQSIYRAV
jgi:hypothetical protein